MIRHQHVGVNRTVVLERGFGEFQQIAGVVTRSGKAGVPVVSALDDVLRNAW
jgi:hypothetical protein